MKVQWNLEKVYDFVFLLCYFQVVIRRRRTSPHRWFVLPISTQMPIKTAPFESACSDAVVGSRTTWRHIRLCRKSLPQCSQCWNKTADASCECALVVDGGSTGAATWAISRPAWSRQRRPAWSSSSIPVRSSPVSATQSAGRRVGASTRLSLYRRRPAASQKFEVER